MINFLGFKAKVRPRRYKKARYAIRNVSKKDLSKMIREFEKFERLCYEKKRPKNYPTDSYFYLSRQLAKCMIKADSLNWQGYGSYTEMTDMSSNVHSTDEDKPKCIIVHKTSSQSYSKNEDKWKQSIVNKKLSPNYPVDVEKLSSTEEYKS